MIEIYIIEENLIKHYFFIFKQYKQVDELMKKLNSYNMQYCIEKKNTYQSNRNRVQSK